MLVTGGHWQRAEPDAVPEIIGARTYVRDGFIVAWFGRLDNTRECGRVCAVDAAQPEPLVLALYQRWGVDGFAHLVGDFAVSLWDPRTRRLVLAVDAPGRTSMYYHASPDSIAWSLSARRLAETIGPSLTPSEEFMAGFLTNRPSLDSPYRGVVRVPSASAVLFDRGKTQTVCYWTPDPSRQLRYRTDREYEEHFLSVFTEAVACRLPASGPVACELSGGVDSSTIVCVADRLVKTAATGCDALLLLSYVFERSSLSDERQYINHVTSLVSWPAVQFGEIECPLLTKADLRLVWEQPTTQLLFLSRQDRAAAAMQERGASVLLSGIGGDQLFWSHAPKAMPLADLLYQRQWIALRRDTSVWARALGWSFRRTLWQGAVAPVLALHWRRLHRARLPPLAEWLTNDFVRRHGLRDYVAAATPNDDEERPSSALQCALLRQTMRPFALDRVTSLGAVDVRYPYLDRRLVEFALKLPLEQSIRPSESRSIVRRSCQGLLPQAICTRVSKSGPDQAFLRAVARERRWIETLFSDARTAQLGLVDPRAFRGALQRACHGRVADTTQFMRTIALEIWLRSLECSQEPAGYAHLQQGRHLQGERQWTTPTPSRI
jgi:asparagine synthase (glutamine-hydrolysing)